MLNSRKRFFHSISTNTLTWKQFFFTLGTLFFILYYLGATFAYAKLIYEIKDEGQYTALLQVQKEIDAISEAVMKCLDTGTEHKECMCESKELFERFTSSVKDLFTRFPDLANRDLVTFKEPEGIQVTQSLEGIKRQAEVLLDCP